MKLLRVHKVDEALAEMSRHFSSVTTAIEQIDLHTSDHRILAEDILSPIDLPEFSKSTVDGYAVKAASTIGASESMPSFFNVLGEVKMGEAASLSIDADSCVYVPTGGMLPENSDGMVMIEYVEKLDERTIAAGAQISAGDGIIRRGDDIRTGQLLVEKGTRLSYREIALLAGCGVYQVPVSQKPRVAIISTGDEIVGPGMPVSLGKVRDINSFALASMAKAAGSEVVHVSCMADDFSGLQQEVKHASEKADIIIISGGSSAGLKDETANVIDSLGTPGVFVHGVAVKPGKPTIIGAAGGKAYFGLPGHPGSAMIIFQVFVEPFIKKLLGEKKKEITLRANCSANLPAAPGKETYVMVRLERDASAESGYLAVPLHGKSAAIGYFTKADGYIRINENTEGVRKGEPVDVSLFLA